MHTARSLCSDRASVPLGRYIATELEPSSRPSSSQARSLRSDRASVLLGRYIATELSQARSLRSDRACVLFGCYVATELFRNVDTTPIHAFSSILRCYLPKTVVNSVHVFRPF
ncbi:hypothetical protein IGI04_014941 [Brassica rapa subsp. trilocularis]|uniref:Uncharacterized protein n=1 Tax=Brassica rapa subsp. trilocularis TaxID=1813537 RepID=A0ABQ7MS27_BRACM|nr:hypothetical protein IGI04_014941 [Brassica rapa subsp. trilocularis]